MGFRCLIATQEIARIKDEWRREAPPLIFWVYVLSKTYIAIGSKNQEIELDES
jgi:hypothetical protein